MVRAGLPSPWSSGVHHVSEHPSRMSPVYTTRSAPTEQARRFLIALNFGDDEASLPLDVAESGTVVVSTGVSRVGVQVTGSIDLAAHEGVIVALPQLASGDEP